MIPLVAVSECGRAQTFVYVKLQGVVARVL